MPLKLTPLQQEKFEEVLVDAYDLDRFNRMLRLRLGFRLEDEMDIHRGKKLIVSQVVDTANKEGWVEKLATGAAVMNTGNFYLTEFVERLNIQPMQKVGNQTLPAVEMIAIEDNLEKAVRKRAPLMVFADFTGRLNSLGPRICRIEYPERRPWGTGWLVAPDLILTAWHVIEKIAGGKDGLTPADICCRFDYSAEPDRTNTPPGRTCHVAESWLIDSSPYSQNDLKASNTDPSPEESDYALIRLAENVGNDILAGDRRRGWIEVMENAPVMTRDDFMIIPQHPDGRLLELAFGEILEYNANATRIRYDTNTEPGSSGSGCFSIELIPFGLHHASGPDKNLEYNQAVPLRAIIKSMKIKGVPPFWV